MSENVELKPCPFCGGEAKCYDYAPTWATTHKWVVECSICGGTTSPCKTKKKAIEAWNRRKDDERA